VGCDQSAEGVGASHGRGDGLGVRVKPIQRHPVNCRANVAVRVVTVQRHLSGRGTCRTARVVPAQRRLSVSLTGGPAMGVEGDRAAVRTHGIARRCGRAVGLVEGGAAFLLGVGVDEFDQWFGIHGGQRAADQHRPAAVGFEDQMPAGFGHPQVAFEASGFAVVGADRVEQFDQPPGQPGEPGRVELGRIPDHQRLGVVDRLTAEVGWEFAEHAADRDRLLIPDRAAQGRLAHLDEAVQLPALADQPMRLGARQPLVDRQPGGQRHPHLALGGLAPVRLASERRSQRLNATRHPHRGRHQVEPFGVRQQPALRIDADT